MWLQFGRTGQLGLVSGPALVQSAREHLQSIAVGSAGSDEVVAVQRTRMP